jgi:hypothetical protein
VIYLGAVAAFQNNAPSQPLVHSLHSALANTCSRRLAAVQAGLQMVVEAVQAVLPKSWFR